MKGQKGLAKKTEGYQMKFDLPGLKPEEITIEVNGNMMIVRGEHYDEKNNKNVHAETYEKFERSFTLPTPVDAAKVRKSYKKGVLTLVVPQAKEGK
jgi:HSP20 family protein